MLSCLLRDYEGQHRLSDGVGPDLLGRRLDCGEVRKNQTYQAE